jgi:hypothetical protein
MQAKLPLSTLAERRKHRYWFPTTMYDFFLSQTEKFGVSTIHQVGFIDIYKAEPEAPHCSRQAR